MNWLKLLKRRFDQALRNFFGVLGEHYQRAWEEAILGVLQGVFGCPHYTAPQIQRVMSPRPRKPLTPSLPGFGQYKLPCCCSCPDPDGLSPETGASVGSVNEDDDSED